MSWVAARVGWGGGMKTINIVCEGQTEEAFANRVLAPYFADRDTVVSASCVYTNRKLHARGGGGSYEYYKNDLLRWMRQTTRTNTYFTSMIDLYKIPDDFPGLGSAAQIEDVYKKVEVLEENFKADLIDDDLWRFVPYLQLHEFESLIFADPEKLRAEFIDQEEAIDSLVQVAAEFGNPELINQGHTTAPSKRIIRELPGYSARKSSAGPLVTEQIGMPVLLARCQHFREWIARLEGCTG